MLCTSSRSDYSARLFHRFAGKFFALRVSWTDAAFGDYFVERVERIESYVDGLIAIHFADTANGEIRICALWEEGKQPTFYNEVDIRAALDDSDGDDEEFDPDIEHFIVATDENAEGEQFWIGVPTRPTTRVP